MQIRCKPYVIINHILFLFRKYTKKNHKNKILWFLLKKINFFIARQALVPNCLSPLLWTLRHCSADMPSVQSDTTFPAIPS